MSSVLDDPGTRERFDEMAARLERRIFELERVDGRLTGPARANRGTAVHYRIELAVLFARALPVEALVDGLRRFLIDEGLGSERLDRLAGYLDPRPKENQ